MQRHLEERLETVERALTDGETDLGSMAAGAATAERVESLEDRLDALEDDVGELDASLQAVRGYVGELRAVNSDVEETAAAAMATAERAASGGDRTEGERRSRPRSTPVDRGGAKPAGHGDARQDAGGDTPGDSSTRSTDASHPDHGSHGSPPTCPTCGRHDREHHGNAREPRRDPGPAWAADEPVTSPDEPPTPHAGTDWPTDEPGTGEGTAETGGLFGRLRSLL